MPGHVKGDDAKVLCKLLIGKKMSPLPAVGAGGVQADQRNARAAFLEIDAMHLAIDIDMNVGPTIGSIWPLMMQSSRMYSEATPADP